MVILSSSSSSQSLMLQISQTILEEEAREAKREKIRHMEKNCPSVSIPGTMPDLQVKLNITFMLGGGPEETQQTREMLVWAALKGRLILQSQMGWHKALEHTLGFYKNTFF